MTLNLSRWSPKELDGLNEQLSKTAVQGDHPLSFYVRELIYERSVRSRYIDMPQDGTDWLPRDTRRQIVAILNACDQLRRIYFHTPIEIIDWPGVLRRKKKLEYLVLEQWLYNEQKYSFWSLFNALTTTSPNIESINLEPRWYKEERENPDTATIEKTAREHGPCRKLETVAVNDKVWTVPLLRYFTIMAPNLVNVHLYLKYEKNLIELKSTLEACLKKWSETLKKILICYSHNEDNVPELRRRQLLLLTFPKMERLERLALLGVQISSTSLYDLKLLYELILTKVDHRDIVATLSRPSVLQKLARIIVDEPDLYVGVVAKRERVYLFPWRNYHCPYTCSIGQYRQVHQFNHH